MAFFFVAAQKIKRRFLRGFRRSKKTPKGMRHVETKMQVGDPLLL